MMNTEDNDSFLVQGRALHVDRLTADPVALRLTLSSLKKESFQSRKY
jgi:hypothetical protein